MDSKMDTKQFKEITLFKGLSEDELEMVSSLLTEVFFPKGAVIWEEGSPEQGLYIIDYGKVRVTRRAGEGYRQVLAVLKKNNFFGELSLLDGRSHSASVEAVEDTKALVLHRADIEKMLQETPRTAYKIVSEMTIAICEILREMNYKFIEMVNYVWV